MYSQEKILILGGTNFIGRNLVEALIQTNEYEITLFNRGQTNDRLFPNITKILGDRQTGAIAQIGKTDWDYVVDLSCFYPADLEQTLTHLKTKPKKYLFISTCSVYDNENYKDALRNEDSPILSCTENQALDTSVDTYGHRKGACEKILASAGINYSILRPALVYGQYDATDRFYYWLHQIKKHDSLLLPESGQRTFSTTYVLDLVSAIIKSLQIKTNSNIFNIISTPKTSILRIVQITQRLTDRDNESFNASADFLNKNNIAQWSGIPLWLNADYFTYDNARFKEELSITPTELSKSIKETIGYYDQLNWPTPIAGIKNEHKNKLLEQLALEKSGQKLSLN